MRGKERALLLASILLMAGCMEQYNPYPYWKKLAEEQAIANRPGETLTPEGMLPASATLAPGASKSALFDPAKAFAGTCVACHGPKGDARINNARDLTDAAWQAEATDEQIKAVIEYGAVAATSKADFSKRSAAYTVSNPLMTPWGSIIVVAGSNEQEKSEQLDAMVKYVRNLKK